jgi:hypothetical protein
VRGQAAVLVRWVVCVTVKASDCSVAVGSADGVRAIGPGEDVVEAPGADLALCFLILLRHRDSCAVVQTVNARCAQSYDNLTSPDLDPVTSCSLAGRERAWQSTPR